MSLVPTILVAGLCAAAIIYPVAREARIVRREDREWERTAEAARREDERLARCDSLEALWNAPTYDPERASR